eukprot:gb/GECG01013531.1/.p1 GENE.gb/GECG01013531.1/~~gb/GECG01013531.1/.p1  ORF type:complete len:334 (+),score=31.59 gb/GECG01013531.1/:1-1002(+)
MIPASYGCWIRIPYDRACMCVHLLIAFDNIHHFMPRISIGYCTVAINYYCCSNTTMFKFSAECRTHCTDADSLMRSQEFVVSAAFSCFLLPEKMNNMLCRWSNAFLARRGIVDWCLRPYSTSPYKASTLLVSNLPWDTDKEELQSRIGAVLGNEIVPRNTRICYENAQSLGFGTVEFDSEKEAQDARQKLHDREVVPGRPLLVSTVDEEAPKHSILRSGEGSIASPTKGDKRKKTREPRPKKHVTSYVLVENVPTGMGWKDLKSIFREHSPKFAEFLASDKALVSLFGTQEARTAVEKLNRSEHFGMELSLKELPRDSLGRPIIPSKKRSQKT